MRTIGDLLTILNHYKDNYPEFEKYNLCIDVSPNDDFQGIGPDLRDVKLYVNTDIGQVEIMPDLGEK